MFTKAEQIKILEQLGYTILREDIIASRKSKIYSSHGHSYVMIEDKKTDIETVFKSEVKRRLFGL